MSKLGCCCADASYTTWKGKDWHLTHKIRAFAAVDAFQALLDRMRQEGGSVEERYESLRRRLIAFFRLHLPADAEALADRALDRVARKLMEGTKIENLLQFTLGVSRMILVECQSQRSRELRAQEGYAGMIEQPATPPEIGEFEEDEARLQERVRALRKCLAKLGEQATHVILTYYDTDGSERIARRRRLAAELGLSLNALRNRALRLRGMLERSLASSTATRLADASITHFCKYHNQLALPRYSRLYEHGLEALTSVPLANPELHCRLSQGTARPEQARQSSFGGGQSKDGFQCRIRQVQTPIKVSDQ
jgi:hypothetical protein